MRYKSTKKSTFVLIILFVSLCIIEFVGMSILKDGENEVIKENKLETEKKVSYYEFDVCTYDEFYKEGRYLFFEDEVVYECQSIGESDCYITQIDGFGYCNKTDSIALITDNKKDFLYDYKSHEIKLEADSIEKVIYDELANVAYFIFRKNGKEGIATLKGEILIEAIYDSISISYPDFSGEYSLRSGTVVARLNSKYGVVEIETGDIVVPFEYKEIKVFDNFYALKEADKYRLVDLTLKDILIESFDDILVLNNIIIVENNKTISFYNLSGTKIVEDTLKINRSYSHYDNKGYSVYSMDEYNKIFTIEIYGDNTYDFEGCYEIYLDTKTLKTLDCKEIFDFDE